MQRQQTLLTTISTGTLMPKLSKSSPSMVLPTNTNRSCLWVAWSSSITIWRCGKNRFDDLLRLAHNMALVSGIEESPNSRGPIYIGLDTSSDHGLFARWETPQYET